MQKTISVDGNIYLESYSKHNNLVYESGKLKLKEVTNKEYNNYHNIAGVIGKRNCEDRVKEFDINDIKGKHILDIGCSMGGMLIASYKLGATKCVGLEYNKTSVEFANKYCMDNDLSNIDIKLQDIDDFDWFRNIEKFDTVFLLSILNTSNFSEKDSLISIANRIGKVLYIEGHSGENHLSYLKKLYYHTDYTLFTHKYVTDGLGKRPLIRCGYGGTIIGKKGNFKYE
jgi:SAM-dependent methyltransferase